MPERKDREVVIRGARQHNLRGFDLTLPRERLTVITGVSGSGKSSLAFDTLFREGQRRFLETLPSYARSFVGGLARPSVTCIDGLGPAVAVSQHVNLSNPRSTVGTLTEVWDLLRLLFARLGTSSSGVGLSRGLFSFNGTEGACPACKGLGVEDRLDLDLLVADPKKSLRDGALRVSTPNGYLMYSQVTLQVLDDVLRAHGGSVDIPWHELSDEARHVVHFGSERLKVPFGKHPLASRMKWTGITARPRQDGFYRGLVPVMEEILRGKRNDSILRFVRSSPCSACRGTRLCPDALSVLWQEQRIVDLAAKTAKELRSFLARIEVPESHSPVFTPVRDDIHARCSLMVELGLGYLSFDRAAPTLSRGEAQRLRLLSLALGELRGLLVVLDEPSAGLHPQDTDKLLGVLRRLCSQGQTVVVVEHDPMLARAADWLVDLGPGPGHEGGRLLFSGPPAALLDAEAVASPTPTHTCLTTAPAPRVPREDKGVVPLRSLTRHNLCDIEIALRRNALNLVTGVSGAGKSSLLDAAVEQLRSGESPFRRIITVDAHPIGRTPRSNPATYSGAFERIRDRFAAIPEAKAGGLTKSHFSFNSAGGRCERCEGAGVVNVGMRYLGSVDLVCDACGGKRFHPNVLAVRYRDRTIADVLEGSIASATEVFADDRKLQRILGTLVDLGLGYLSLGQPATTLSGGEAQRIKLGTELAKTSAGAALIALDEPTTGLHGLDVQVFLRAWEGLLGQGHTLLVVDHDLDVVRAADHVIDLGPGCGPEGGRVVFQGSPEDLVRCAASATGAALIREAGARGEVNTGRAPELTDRTSSPSMQLRGVRTHNLRGFDVDIPSQGLTVVTGPSGCGKSSLVFDTLLAESQNRFADLVAPWARRLLPKRGGAEVDSARNLQAAIAVPQRPGRRNPRSTVGTVSELDELLRMLFSRAGTRPCPSCGGAVEGDRCSCGVRLGALWAGAFSPNTESGACPTCRGLGFVQRCDPARLVAHPERPLDGGAMGATRFGTYLGEADGQHMATMRAALAASGFVVSGPWSAWGEPERALALHGTGARSYEVVWRYKRGRREGEHRFTGPWRGLLALVDEEYERVHADPQGASLEGLMMDVPCSECHGERLGPASRCVVFAGRTYPAAARMSLDALRSWLEDLAREPAAFGLAPRAQDVSRVLLRDLLQRLETLSNAGLGYLSSYREVASLSGGEAQRLRLASALGGGLVGVTYVLDEPTQGLHPRDTARLARVLRSLAESGNAVVVVEHDKALVSQADHVLEIGPGAGPNGGHLVAQGSPESFDARSHTARLLRRKLVFPVSANTSFRPGVTLVQASLHNLQNVDVCFPVGALVVVTGVSGSGKSTLVHDVLGPSLQAMLDGRAPIGCQRVQLHVELSDIQVAHQGALPVAGSSSVASLVGISELLRKRFAATPRAKANKWKAKHFSTATPGGRCEACAGRGVVTVAMDLLPDVTVGCDVCQGRRFLPEVLGCLVHDRSIAELLDSCVGEVAGWFPEDTSITGPLSALCELGMDYLRVGQDAATLSAGELQRLRLAMLLAKPRPKPVALLLDEPTKGLGFEDVDRLIGALRRLAGAGHLVVVVEHDLDLIAASDWLVDLGPEGGDEGGTIVAQGTPWDVCLIPASHTGRALASHAAEV